MPRVLFVSKPIAPPFHDGTKCLVRDVASHLTQVEPVLMSTPHAPPLRSAHGGRVLEAAPAYGDPGRFTPALSANLRAAAWLLARSRADLWHVVFAPNPRTSAALAAFKRLKRKPVVQTVASPPRSFSDPTRLFFGDVLVAQSRWTASRIEEAFGGVGIKAPQLEVIPPPAPEVRAPSSEEISRELESRGLSREIPFFVYPGDLETSSGGEACAALLAPLLRELPAAVLVFAYRGKTPRAGEQAARLRARLPAERVRFVADTPRILALLAAARAVLFPVDDLWGKVDIPIVLLEAMTLGVPVLALARGPLSDLQGVANLADLSPEGWAAEAVRLHRDQAERAALIACQRAALERYQPDRIARGYERLYFQLLQEHDG